jgi:hypothetical protein
MDSLIVVVGKGLLAVAGNYVVHYGSSRIYDAFCVPHTLGEVIYTLVSTSSPVCVVALGTMQMTQNNYGTLLTTTLASHLVMALKVT